MKNHKTTHNKKRNFVWILTVLMFSGLFGMASMSLAAEGSWTKKADMPTARYGVSAAVVDGKIYVAGGWNNKAGFLKTVEMYDPDHNIWKPKAELSQGNIGVALAAVNGKIYAIGGAAVGGKIYAMGLSLLPPQPLSNTYEYDPTTDKWTQKADMPTARGSVSAGNVGGKIYVVGGFTSFAPMMLSSTVEIYDAETDAWTRGVDLPDDRCGHASAVVKGVIYVFGGSDKGVNPNSPPDSVVSTVYAFDTGTFSVSPRGKLATTWGEIKR